MRTVYTAPNGNADVVTDGGFFRVRERRTDGTWLGPAGRYTATWRARQAADRVDAWVEGKLTNAQLYARPEQG